MTTQRRIYQSVNQRGYGSVKLGLTDQQFAARQLVKILEETLEALDAVRLPDYPGFMRHRTGMEAAFKEMFDNVPAWRKAVVRESDLITELADIAVPAYCAAEALGVDLAALAANKALADVDRGVRNNENQRTSR